MSAAPITAKALLLASFHALRSYEFGNGSPELAKECADAIEKFLGSTGDLQQSRAALMDELAYSNGIVAQYEADEAANSLRRGKEVADKTP